MPGKGSVFTLNNGSFIARHDCESVAKEGAMMQIISVCDKARQSFATLDTIKQSRISCDLCGC